MFALLMGLKSISPHTLHEMMQIHPVAVFDVNSRPDEPSYLRTSLGDERVQGGDARDGSRATAWPANCNLQSVDRGSPEKWHTTNAVDGKATLRHAETQGAGSRSDSQKEQTTVGRPANVQKAGSNSTRMRLLGCRFWTPGILFAVGLRLVLNFLQTMAQGEVRKIQRGGILSVDHSRPGRVVVGSTTAGRLLAA